MFIVFFLYCLKADQLHYQKVLYDPTRTNFLIAFFLQNTYESCYFCLILFDILSCREWKTLRNDFNKTESLTTHLINQGFIERILQREYDIPPLDIFIREHVKCKGQSCFDLGLGAKHSCHSPVTIRNGGWTIWDVSAANIW